MGGLHNNALQPDNHIPDGLGPYADAAARNGAAGLVAADVCKLATQTDTEQLWKLKDEAGPDWDLVSAGPGSNVYYVGKDGADTNAGQYVGDAFLTFGAAIAAANALTPAVDKVFTIVCLDGGIYTEDLTTAAYVNIFAPGAQLVGEITLADNVAIELHTIKNTAADALTKSAGTGASFVRARVLETTGAHNCCVITAASATCWVALDVDFWTCVDGDLLNISGAGSFAHVAARLAYITGNGDGLVASAAGCQIRGQVDYLLGLGTSEGILLSGGAVARLVIAQLQVTSAGDIGAGSSLALTVSEMSDSFSGAGTIVVNDASTTQTHIDGDGSDHSDVGLNNTHRGSAGTDHSDVGLNNTHRGSAGSDHSIVTDNQTALGNMLFGTFTTTGGGGATETYTLNGVAAGKPIFGQLNVKGASPQTIVRVKYNAANTIEVEWSADPGSDHEFSVWTNIA
jgi:hypothetical protein